MKCEKEKKFITKLNELRKLNSISTKHTDVFKKVCGKKKRQIKDQLNDLVKELRKIGTNHPDIKRYL